MFLFTQGGQSHFCDFPPQHIPGYCRRSPHLQEESLGRPQNLLQKGRWGKDHGQNSAHVAQDLDSHQWSILHSTFVEGLFLGRILFKLTTFSKNPAAFFLQYSIQKCTQESTQLFDYQRKFSTHTEISSELHQFVIVMLVVLCQRCYCCIVLFLWLLIY